MTLPTHYRARLLAHQAHHWLWLGREHILALKLNQILGLRQRNSWRQVVVKDVTASIFKIVLAIEAVEQVILEVCVVGIGDAELSVSCAAPGIEQRIWLDVRLLDPEAALFVLVGAGASCLGQIVLDHLLVLEPDEDHLSGDRVLGVHRSLQVLSQGGVAIGGVRR